MARYRSLRNGRRKTPVLCPTQRDNRIRARLCASESCTPYNATLEGTDSFQVTIKHRPVDTDWPGSIDGITMTVDGSPSAVTSAIGTGNNLTITQAVEELSGQDLTISIPAFDGNCPLYLELSVPE